MRSERGKSPSILQRETATNPLPPLPPPPHGANKRQLQNKGSAGAAGPPAHRPPDPSAAGPPAALPRRAERSPGRRSAPAARLASAAAEGPRWGLAAALCCRTWRPGEGGGRGLLPPQPAEGGAALTPRPPRSCWR